MSPLTSHLLPDGSMSPHIERPASANGALVVVLHEVFGINDDMRATCCELALHGYLAVCPGLFWRIASGFSLSRWTEADLPRVQTLYCKLDRNQAARDIVDLVDSLRHSGGGNGRVGLLGYCMGGLMTFLATARGNADASVAYYPGQVELNLDELPSVRTPLLVHLAGEDEYMPSGVRSAISVEAAKNSQVQLFNYPGCHHAFARHGGDYYNAYAATLANGRTQEILARWLG